MRVRKILSDPNFSGGATKNVLSDRKLVSKVCWFILFQRHVNVLLEKRTWLKRFIRNCRLRFRPTVLVDVGRIFLQTTLLGEKIAFPVGIAPTSFHKLAHPLGELATAGGMYCSQMLRLLFLFLASSKGLQLSKLWNLSQTSSFNVLFYKSWCRGHVFAIGWHKISVLLRFRLCSNESWSLSFWTFNYCRPFFDTDILPFLANLKNVKYYREPGQTMLFCSLLFFPLHSFIYHSDSDIQCNVINNQPSPMCANRWLFTETYHSFCISSIIHLHRTNDKPINYVKYCNLDKEARYIFHKIFHSINSPCLFCLFVLFHQ